MRAKAVIVAFVVFLSVFSVTHALKFPGSVAFLMETTRGEKMLDMQPSFSAAETFRRLEAFGDDGRRLYRRTILTVDVIFPLTFFLFLFTWARYVSDRSGVRPALGRAISVPAVVYVLADLIENVAILAMLSRFPERLEFLGGSIGYVTQAKRISMVVALLLPPAFLLVRTMVRRRPRNAGSS